ncbi:MAG: DNA N-6-adenine-methyltransferase [Ignavibacteria bacterium]|jgi:phage N-6-adenine-methyltransferase
MNTSYEKLTNINDQRLFGTRTISTKDEWLTPKYIIEALGEFDLDPCSPLTLNRPWDTAKKHLTLMDDGLKHEWKGRVWLNPPYGKKAVKWIKKLQFHGNGIALLYARTDTKMFFDHIWNNADSIFFIKGRIKFYHSNGVISSQNAGAPSVLIAYGFENSKVLQECNIKGKFIELKRNNNEK